MAKQLKIIKAPDNRLNKHAQNITNFKKIKKHLEEFIENLIHTMITHDGCGLASTQVEDQPQFELKEHHNYRAQPNIIICKPNDKIIVAINPQILEYSNETDCCTEGCLSIPKQTDEIPRSTSIIAQYQNIEGETVIRKFEQFEARVFQHEYDHTIGIIYPNRLTSYREKFFWLKYNNKKVKS